MQPRLWSVLLCSAILCEFAGCANYAERRVVESFIKSWEKADLEGLKEVSSTDFQSSTLRHDEAKDAFKILNVPTGDVEVVKVTEDGPDSKRVLVAVGEKDKKRKMYCDLVRDPKTKKWLVDDIEFKRRLKPGQVNKTVSEQMDLLISVQEFMDAWESGKRDEILATSTPEMRKVLEALPASGLSRFTTRVMHDLKLGKIQPEVRGHANSAVVRLPTKSGEILVTLRQIDAHWLADDLAVISRRETTESITSVRKQAAVMQTAVQFCEAYRDSNKPAIEKLCVARFYRLNLENAEFKHVPLPPIDLAKGEIDIKLLGPRAEVLLKNSEQIIQLSLNQGIKLLDSDNLPVEDDSTSNKPYLVEEVTLHELKTKQNKRLSAMFSSHTIIQRFAQAMTRGDLKEIRGAATTDFNTRVWNRVELEDLGDLPLESVEPVEPQIIDSQFKGSLTEVTVNQGRTPLTYILRDQNGTLMVDDVLTPALDRPNSLKMTLEVVIPLTAFRNGMRSRDLEIVKANVSREFNKLVFQSMNRIPKLKTDPTPYISSHLNRIQITPDRALLILGDEHHGAKVFLQRESGRYVVDDVVMVGGLEQRQRVGLKQALRQLVVGGTQIGTTVLQRHDQSESSDVPRQGEDEEESIEALLKQTSMSE